MGSTLDLPVATHGYFVLVYYILKAQYGVIK
jgi:hypothetical protein